jgi:hypothetical protein
MPGLKHKQARYRQRHRELGLCILCANPARPGKATCAACTDKDRAGKAARRQYRLENRLCVVCGLPLGEQDAGFTSHHRSECNPSRRLL